MRIEENLLEQSGKYLPVECHIHHPFCVYSLSAASGILFPGHEEAAFSNFRLLESIGSVCFYVISPLLCTRTKLFSLLVGIVLGLSGYSTIEYLERRAKSGKVDERKFELVTSDATVL